MSDTPVLRHYCIVRDDLTTEEKFAQLIHAAGESVFTRVPASTYAIALQGSLAEIQAIIPALRLRDYFVAEIIEGHDHRFAGQLVAIGIEPSAENRLRKLLYHFPLATSGTPRETGSLTPA